MSTVSRPPVSCPACGETNEGDMQFCIFCGGAMAQKDMYPLSDVVVSASPSVVLICGACSRTDPLHGQFCVFCGGRTYSSDSAKVQQRSTYVPRLERPSSHISGEYPYPTYNNNNSIGLTVAMVFLLGILGLAVGGGGIYFGREALDLQSSLVEKLWPADGLVLYTEKDGANVVINDNEERVFTFGMTGQRGSVSIGHIAPGKYRVKVEGLKTKAANVNPGRPEVIGYPEPVKMETQGF